MSVATENKKDSENKNNKLIIIIIVLLAIIVLILVAIVAYLLGKGQSTTAGGNSSVGEEPRREVTGSVRTVIDESNAEDVINQMREEVAEGMFECKMSMKWTFEDGKSASKDAYVANSVNNTHPIFFDIYMNDTDELIYSSPILPVGTDLTDIKLDTELPAGEYKVTVMYTLIKDVETQEPISSAGYVITIKVLN
jgi:hypothetical protein